MAGPRRDAGRPPGERWRVRASGPGGHPGIEFHDFGAPVAWLRNVKQYLKPLATVIILDRDPAQGADRPEAAGMRPAGRARRRVPVAVAGGPPGYVRTWREPCSSARSRHPWSSPRPCPEAEARMASRVAKRNERFVSSDPSRTAPARATAGNLQGLASAGATFAGSPPSERPARGAAYDPVRLLWSRWPLS
jgi:hypothetical protein